MTRIRYYQDEQGPFQAPHWCHGRTKRQCELHMERNPAPRGFHHSMFKSETFGGYGVALVASPVRRMVVTRLGARS